MSLQYAHTILLVDDEASIVSSLKRLLRRDKYRILTAGNGREALEVLEEAKDTVSLIISDQRMPEMNGSEFLEKAVDLSPHSIRFLLTGYADLNAVADAVNKGRIHRYITKPWNDKELRDLVRMALSQVELHLENRRLTKLTEQQNIELAELNKDLERKVQERTWALQVQNKMLKGSNLDLEKSLMNSVRLLSSLAAQSNTRLGIFMMKTAELAKEMAAEAEMDENAQIQIEMAALVHDIGLLGMPEHIIGKDAKTMKSEEFESYRQHPFIASLALDSIDGFDAISEIVRCHHEQADGKGFPNGLTAKQIPGGAKILAIASNFCTILYLWPDHVRDMMVRARRHLDRELLATMDITDPSIKREIAEAITRQGAGTQFETSTVELFSQTMERKHPKPIITLVKDHSLKAGMTLMGELRLKDGRLLLSKGTVLNDQCIRSIQHIGAHNITGDSICVAQPCNG